MSQFRPSPNIPLRPSQNAPAAVRIAGLSKRYQKRIVVNQVDLAIQPGETFGLLGPNGAGCAADSARC